MDDPRIASGIEVRPDSSTSPRARHGLVTILFILVILFTAGICRASGAGAATCAGLGGDRAYLSEVDVIVEPSPHHPGETVTARRVADGFVLRESSAHERFVDDLSQGALATTYSIVPRCGGFDVTYTLRNTSSSPQRLPDLRVDGLRQAPAGDVYLLNTKEYGNVQKILNPSQTTFIDQPYPTWLYSPVIVSHDSNAAFGSALLYPVLHPEYRHTVRPVLQRTGSGSPGSWSHIYHHFTEETGLFPEGPPSMVRAGEERQFTITVRFSEPRYWLLTLVPYKEYFSQLYWHDSDPRPRDLRPVFATSVVYGGPLSLYEIDWESNPRAYRLDYRIDLRGWHDFVHDTIDVMQQNHYSRVMTWGASGLYNVHISDFNFPPQFMSDWLPMVFDTQSELRAYGHQGISLGYWWGRSTQIPQPVQWNPPLLVSAQLSNPAHLRFLTNELTLARDRGGREIGLDYFFEIPLYDRYGWVDQMKQIAPGVNFIHEGAGPDVMSTKLSQWYQTPHPGGQVMEAPDVLSAYLLPFRPELWVFLGHTTEPQELINRETIQKLVRWGFTPAVSKYPYVNVSGLDYSQVQCFDNIDNDNDGLTDWPYDPGCATAAGDSERALFTLAVARTGGGGGTVTSAPGGIACGGDCSEAYVDGTVVTLSPAPAAGSLFAGWSGDADCADGIVTLNANKTCTARFELKPDLIVPTLAVPGAAVAGSMITATDTTRNQGTGPAEVSTTRFYLSTNPTWDAGDTHIGARSIPVLTPGAASSGPAAVTIPGQTATGNYYVIAKADADGVLVESIETNNTRSVAIRISPPDLVVSALTAPATGGAGLPITVTDTTRNQTGTGPAPASTTRLYLSTNPTWDAGDTLLGSREIPALTPGTASPGSTSLTIPAGTAVGTYYILAVADAPAAIAETNEANNTRASLIRLSPDLVVSSLSAPSSAHAGTSISVTDTTRNQGQGSAAATRTTFYLSGNTTVDNGDAVLGSRDIPILASAAASPGSIPVTIPAGTPTGVRYILARADATGAVAETSEANNTTVRTITIAP